MDVFNEFWALLIGLGVSFFLIMIAIAVFQIICLWKIFEKAGKPGWAAIIPIYNIIVLLEVAGKPVWWIILFFIPFVNVVIGIMVIHGLSTSFKQGVGFTLGLIFLRPIFLAILAFGDYQHDTAVNNTSGALDSI